jgi:outer membrane cobalamin receptor
LSANWDISQNISVLFAAKNLLDENHALVDGFAEGGRNMTLSLRLRN